MPEFIATTLRGHGDHHRRFKSRARSSRSGRGWIILNAKDKYHPAGLQRAHSGDRHFGGTGAGEAAGVRQSRRTSASSTCPIAIRIKRVHMLRNVQTAIAHIGPVICRGEWHMGMDATLLTFMDDLPGNFFPVTNADLHAKVDAARAAAAQGRIAPGQSPARAGLSSGVNQKPGLLRSRIARAQPASETRILLLRPPRSTSRVLAPIVSVSIRAGIPT